MYPRLSWSSLQAYEDCPRRYYEHRLRHRTQIPTKIVLVGNVLHYVSEQLIWRHKPEDEIVEMALRDFDRRVAEANEVLWSPEDEAEKRASVEQGAWRLAELYGELFTATKVGDILPEHHVQQFYSGWMLEGYMDVVTVHPTLRYPKLIADVKTGSSHKVGQLEFYSVLAEAYYGRRVERFAFIEPLGRGIVDVTVTDEDHAAMKTRIMDVVTRISKDEFPTRGFPKKCGWCNASNWCPAMSRAREGKLV